MSLSHYLQSPDILELAQTFDPTALKARMLERGMSWFEQNSSEVDRLRRNLAQFGFEATPSLLESLKEHTILHYFEKLLPLGGTPADFAGFLDASIDSAEALKTIAGAQKQGKGALLATSHFGAVEFIVPTVSRGNISLSAALRFTTQRFSEQAYQRARALYESGLFAPIHFIEIGKPGVSAALDMAAAVRRGDSLASVFDERTEYSKPVDLLGNRVWGGAGLDRFIAFNRQSIAVFAVFMVRNGEGAYTLLCTPIDFRTEDPVTGMYRQLELLAQRYPWQWYFLHEDPPFVDND